MAIRHVDRLQCSLLLIALLCNTNLLQAHNRVVVIPMMGDDALANPISPVKEISPNHSDYFIHSNRVLDETTGLVWQRNLYQISLNWHDAWLYCNNLEVGDLTQWRLPDPQELVMLIDYSERAPAISINAFPGTNSSVDFWTSQFTPNFNVTTTEYNEALVVDFNEGRMARMPLTASMRVRCVHGRSASRGGVLRNNNDGTVSDLASGLIWQQGSSQTNWSEALDYCEALQLGGSTNWRVPTIKELVSVADYRSPYGVHSIDWFSDLGGFIWASHGNVSNTTEAWALNNAAGGIVSWPKSADRRTRCVR